MSVSSWNWSGLVAGIGTQDDTLVRHVMIVDTRNGSVFSLPPDDARRLAGQILDAANEIDPLVMEDEPDVAGD